MSPNFSAPHVSAFVFESRRREVREQRLAVRGAQHGPPRLLVGKVGQGPATKQSADPSDSLVVAQDGMLAPQPPLALMLILLLTMEPQPHPTHLFGPGSPEAWNPHVGEVKDGETRTPKWEKKDLRRPLRFWNEKKKKKRKPPDFCGSVLRLTHLDVAVKNGVTPKWVVPVNGKD